jgi:hypothetical protein
VSEEAPQTEGLVIVQEVKYSLRDLLREVEAERRLSEFAREAVDQEEISKLFERNRSKVKKRRGSR